MKHSNNITGNLYKKNVNPIQWNSRYQKKTVDEILFSQNKEQELQAQLTKLNQWKVRGL